MKEQSPSQTRAAYSEALSALRTGRAATAERLLRAIQAAAPGDIRSLHLLGVAFLDHGGVGVPGLRGHGRLGQRADAGDGLGVGLDGRADPVSPGGVSGEGKALAVVDAGIEPESLMDVFLKCRPGLGRANIDHFHGLPRCVVLPFPGADVAIRAAFKAIAHIGNTKFLVL